MSFIDDKLHWKDAAGRILNLQQSSASGSLVTNLNVILDELNSLDYATNVVDNKEDALPLLSKCCTLVCSCGTDDFLITKFCQLIVNLIAKQKISLNQETLNVLIPFLVNSLNNCKKWTQLNLVKALAATLYENGQFCHECADSLLGADGVLVRLCKDESQDTDVLCGTIQCVANMCTNSVASPDSACNVMEEKFITNAFILLLELLQSSTPELRGTEIEHFMVVNKVLCIFPHVLLLNCSGQKQNLGPLLSALKNYMFCGMPGYKPQYAEKASNRLHDKSAIEPDDLSSVHLSTIPQKDRQYAMLSKRKKRRPANKKTKHTAAVPSHRQATTLSGSSSVDALTPKFVERSSSVDALTPKFTTYSSLTDVLTPKFNAHNSSVDSLTPQFATCSSSVDALTPTSVDHSSSVVMSTQNTAKYSSSAETSTPKFSTNSFEMNAVTSKSVEHSSSIATTTPKSTVHSSSVDALTPAFAACSLSSTPPHKAKQPGSSPSRYAMQSTVTSNFYPNKDSEERSGAESSGYHSSSSLSASSDSEYSDSEAGQNARLRSIMSKIRLNVLLCLQAVVKRTDKKVLFGYWSSFVPDNTVSSSWSLFTTILKDPTPKGRAGGVAVLMDLLDGSRQFLVAAEDRDQHSSSPSARPFTSFSVKLSGIVHELHRCLLQALMAETHATTKAQILKCLSILVLNSPYNRLKTGLLSKVVLQLRPLLAIKDPNLQTAVLSCLRMVVCVHTPLPEVVELMRPSSTEVNTGNMNLTPPGQTSSNSVAEVIPGLQVAFDSPWLIRWCTHCANRRDNSLVVRLEAMQFLASFLKSYVFLASSSVECLTSLACSFLKDGEASFTLPALKVLEELARAMNGEISKTSSGRSEISKDQVFQFWQKLLDGPLTKILQDGSPVSGSACSAALDCLSNIGGVIFNELPLNRRVLCITLLLGLSNDEDKNVKASSVRALGVFVLYQCLREDVLFVADTANTVLSAMTDPKLLVRMRAAWSLANLSDSLVTNMCSEDTAFLEDFSDMLLLKLLNTSITAADDNEKVKSNAVRALGNFLRYIRTSSLEKAGFTEAVEKAVDALMRNLDSNLMKVRWNACYAFGNMFRNPFLPTGTASWTSGMYSTLENVICNCKNFKVRINAVLALSVPAERRYYGDVAVYCHLYATLIDALKSTENVTDFSEFKYRDTLRRELCNSLCHLTSVMTEEDSISLAPLLEERHDTYKGYLVEYIRQPDMQELVLEDQTSEKTTAERICVIQKASRRVHEDLARSDNTTVKILQEVYGATYSETNEQKPNE
ncbi:unnamed protein product [Porites lobata]|uniref:HEAT repeat-containing protein 6 n=1 Tax=Porites lobata TaxID=104759 RepID=A0ABN8NN69_9CNID|nr:unnamed protein product [Porites lobata]